MHSSYELLDVKDDAWKMGNGKVLTKIGRITPLETKKRLNIFITK